ncbi:MAG: type II toxin-antitoxin system Phd/YefM family antitoxin [Gammaproteobacteria bacterium]|nr:type II toxin-antitoxin system Phd/YefM family antitoxin [Gammaproteobacteria bacterium]MCY4164814.1 type II toxin-antitoxin system Phd/YefM family antitoxin [Gammaproteobacteria bacterium]MCY4255222.1 type II toxin-antitoxin system Phd/YefM family antitoxin [Gammaproteobacteria bacterium]MCY4340674.1 type II toxin-antitoxin system Phd/YefM family antitoxin [Gammaproteobacteria bacterium]
MRYVSASNAKQKMAALLDAVQREPVTIRRQNREVAVVISPLDYRRLKSANLEEFEQLCNRVADHAQKRGLTEEKLSELLDL